VNSRVEQIDAKGPVIVNGELIPAATCVGRRGGCFTAAAWLAER